VGGLQTGVLRKWVAYRLEYSANRWRTDWCTPQIGGVPTGVLRKWVAYRLVYSANGWRTDWCTPIMGGVPTCVYRHQWSAGLVYTAYGWLTRLMYMTNVMHICREPYKNCLWFAKFQVGMRRTNQNLSETQWCYHLNPNAFETIKNSSFRVGLYPITMD
jgi:hypothetical protein